MIELYYRHFVMCYVHYSGQDSNLESLQRRVAEDGLRFCTYQEKYPGEGKCQSQYVLDEADTCPECGRPTRTPDITDCVKLPPESEESLEPPPHDILTPDLIEYVSIVLDSMPKNDGILILSQCELSAIASRLSLDAADLEFLEYLIGAARTGQTMGIVEGRKYQDHVRKANQSSSRRASHG